MLTVGTGVGGGIVIDGQVFRGATGAAAELGHIDRRRRPARRRAAPLAARPQPGSLEAWPPGRALDQLGRDRGFTDGRAVVDGAQEGDERALEALRILGERLGIGIANA